ncbi:MAG: DUF4352 domain-containing protein [Actinomycetia bacterium]|nr:DUF4352 domain-containing protein [Actinomycetes bacterium]
MSENYTEEEVIDMVEEPGTDAWVTEETPDSGIGNFGDMGGIGETAASLMGGKKIIPLIIGAVLIGLLLCCASSTLRSCGSSSPTTTNSSSGLSSLLPTQQDQNTDYTARFDQQVTLGGVTFLLEEGTDTNDYGQVVDAFRATIYNGSNQPLTIRNDMGWSAQDARGNSLEYDWYADADGNSSNINAGTIAPGETFTMTLFFMDRNGNSAQANAVMAEFSRSLDGYDAIVWRP